MVTAAAAHVRLSASPIWEQQRAYFEAQGPRAWATGTVPHYVTSNPYMARAFAEVIAGFAADCTRELDRPGTSAPLRPLYVIELGAGSGRLAFHLARLLRDARELRALGWRPVYVMTDVAESTIRWWREHPWLAPLFATGVLDVARFDMTRDATLTLQVSGRTLTPSAPAGPMVVVANYLFDSLPQDVFAGVGGELYECHVAVESTPADLRWSLVPAAPAPYGDPVIDEIANAYRDAGGVVTVPAVALAGLGRLRALAGGSLLLLSADKGGTRLADVVSQHPPAIVRHGSVSMSVNYHAIGAWTLAHGGTSMHTAHHGALEVCAFVLSDGPAAATTSSFERAVAHRGPDDFYRLKRFMVARATELSLSELLAYLRLSGHDAKVLLDCAAGFHAALPGATPDDLDNLALAIAQVWDGYLPIGEPDDVAVALGRLALAIGRFAEAATLFEASRALHGDRLELTRLLVLARTGRLDPRASRPGGGASDDPFAVITGNAPGIALAQSVGR